MRNILIFGGLAIIGYALYNKFGKDLLAKKDEVNQTNTPAPYVPIPLIVKEMLPTQSTSVIESVVVPKKGKFTPNRPIGRPNKASMGLPSNCQCITAPCNC
jgi:hypothetical protein